MEILISMVDFVLEKNKAEEVTRQSYIECSKYAIFLKQPLKLGMFVPCDLDGNVLEDANRSTHTDIECLEYQQAKERCLFEGFTQAEVSYILSCSDNKTVEDIVDYNPKLTATALKQIGL